MISSTQRPSALPSLLGLAAAGGLMLVGTLFLVWLGTPQTPDAVGQPLPKLDLAPLLNTQEIVTNESIQDKVVVLHFWGTWCPPCRKEFPEFAALAQRFSGRSEVSILSVSCSSGPEYNLQELADQTSDFLVKTAPEMNTTFCDPAAMTRSQLAMLLQGGTFSYPTTVVVNRSGLIAVVLEGYREGSMRGLEKTIEELIAQPASMAVPQQQNES